MKKTILIFTIAFIVLLKPTTASVLLLGDGNVTFFNTHFNEKITVQYRFKDGYYNFSALEEINHLLRCRMTNKTHEIDVALLELVDHIQDHFEANEIHVVSAYRSPEMNEKLRSEGRKVAEKSLHMDGEAIDIRIPGISTKELKRYVLALQRGGVGYYPNQQFVHVDVGQIRSW